LPRRLRFKSRRFGTLYRFHLPRQVPRKMEPIEGSETSAFKPQTPGNYSKENILHKEHGESLKSRQYISIYCVPDDESNVSLKMTSQMRPCREMIFFCSEKQTELTSVFYGQSYHYFGEEAVGSHLPMRTCFCEIFMN